MSLKNEGECLFMNTFQDYITEYIEYCQFRKRLDSKTLKAYRIDLTQYNDYSSTLPDCFAKDTVDHYITNLHKQYNPKEKDIDLESNNVLIYEEDAKNRML